MMIGSSHAQPLIWNLDKIDQLRQYPSNNLYKNIVAQAEQVLMKRPVAVTDKTTSRSGNKHNYESLSIYFWPNPSDPDGPYIVRDGVYNPEYKQYDLPRLITLVSNLQHLSIAYYLTRDSRFFDEYCLQLDTWFTNKKTRMNPNFEYSQFIPGKNQGKGCSAGLIDAYTLNDVLESIRLVESVQSLGSKRMKKLKSWFQDFAEWMQESEIGQGEAKAENNHSIAYDITLYDLALFAGEDNLCQQIESRLTNRINQQIQASGKQPQELSRTRAFKYSVFNLQHLMDFCILQSNLGRNYIDNDGKRIKMALSYISQFMGQSGDFPYQEIGPWDDEEKNLKMEIARCKRISSDNIVTRIADSPEAINSLTSLLK